MIDVNQLLNKFRSLVKYKGEQRRAIAEIISNLSGVFIDEESIVLGNNNSITVNCHPALKSEIFLRKKSIIEALNQKLKPQKFEQLL